MKAIRQGKKATKAPNAVTRCAMAELEAGKGRKFERVNALMADLNEDLGFPLSRWS
jgi:hypothetical protein